MSRRARGEGTVLRDGSGWIARLDLPPSADGKRRRQKRRARTKSEAHEALRQMLRDAEEGIDPKGQRRTVAESVAEYIASLPTMAVPRARSPSPSGGAGSSLRASGAASSASSPCGTATTFSSAWPPATSAGGRWRETV